MIKVFRQSSIRIDDGNMVLYFDPYKIEEEYRDADYIFITHEHYDHYDTTSIKKLLKDNTKLIVPECLKDIDFPKIVVKPNSTYNLGNLSFDTICSYNTNKNYHPKEKGYVGYLVNLNNKTYYIMGDTDVTLESLKVKSDYLFIPIGGTFTMNIDEAVDYVKKVKPLKIIPIHYGSIVGDITLGEEFKNKLSDYDVEVLIKEEKENDKY